MSPQIMPRIFSGMLIVAGLFVSAAPLLRAADPAVVEAERRRVEVVERVSPSVVAIFANGGAGGGSGVLISSDGYVLTNFHVTQGAGTFMKCGLNDGRLYDAVIVGIDPTGDVAMIKLFGRDDFPAATLGDSDLVRTGDWAYAMGNPFLLATDFRPTITYGIVSGVHRYQYPAGTILEYTDCIQVDSSINPGNSGGPLFSDNGELIGINGRGSFEKRGRVNSGAGYAISINQIKHFMNHLRSGRIVDHATLGATVSTDDRGLVVVANILEESDAYRRGLRIDDEVVSFAGRPTGSVNQFKNVLGIYPKGWKLPLVFRRDDQKEEIYVRLRGLHRQSELTGPAEPKAKPVPRKPGKQPDGEDPEKPAEEPRKPRKPGGKPMANPHAAAPVPEHLKPFFVEKAGFANYYFNDLEQQRVLKGLQEFGDFSQRGGLWRIKGKANETMACEFKLTNRRLGLTLGDEPYVQDLSDLEELKDEPPGTGGLLTAMHHLRMLLSRGSKGFSEFYYLGSEPLDGRTPDVDVLATELGGAQSHWYFSRENGRLVGFNFQRTDESEPCEVRFDTLRDFSGVKFPATISVRHLDHEVMKCEFQEFEASAAKPEDLAPADPKPAAPAKPDAAKPDAAKAPAAANIGQKVP